MTSSNQGSKTSSPVDVELPLCQSFDSLLGATKGLPRGVESPIGFYRQTSLEVLSMVSSIAEASSTYSLLDNTQLGHLTCLALIGLVECLERFFKEVAAVCIDELVLLVEDDRFKDFDLSGNAMAAHFKDQTVGRAMVESTVFTNTKRINETFSKLLAKIYDTDDGFVLFSVSGESLRKTDPDRKPGIKTTFALDKVWQLRHSAVHNVGYLTKSDAIKLSILARRRIPSPAMLNPSVDQLRSLKLFLEKIAEQSNQLIGNRLATIIGEYSKSALDLIEPQEVADRLSQRFMRSLTVATAQGYPA